jgi:hypothetical protein
MKEKFLEGSGLGVDESVSLKYAIEYIICPFLE